MTGPTHSPRHVWRCPGGGDLHFVVDTGGARIQRSPENAGKTEGIIDAFAVRGEGRAGLQRGLDCDLGIGVGKGENDLSLADHGRLDQVRAARGGDDDIRLLHHFGQAAASAAGGGQHLAGLGLEVGADDASDPEGEQEFGYPHSRRTQTDDPDDGLVEHQAGIPKGIEQGCQGYDSGTVLVVVHDRDVEGVVEGVFDFETFGGGDILQLDGPEGGGDVPYGVDDDLRVLGVDEDGNAADADQSVEKRCLALHDGHPGDRSDIAQAEDGAAVGDDGHLVGDGGVAVGELRYLLDVPADEATPGV